MPPEKNGGQEGPIVVEYLTPFPITGPEVTYDGYTYRLATKHDCLSFRNYADSLDGFHIRYNRHNDVMVWDKKIHGEATHVVKVFGVFPDMKPVVLYDMLQDAVFRKVWDNNLLHACRIVRMNESNDIGYYAAKSPLAMVANRDFLNQRTWLSAGDDEYIIFNTSVPHRAVPVDYLKSEKISNDSVVRGLSKITGYLVRPWVGSDGKAGCSLTYITHSDPGGWIPHSLMNLISTKYAPTTIKNIRHALEKFLEWIPKQTNHVRDWSSNVDAYGVPVEHCTIKFVKEKWAEEEHLGRERHEKKATKKEKSHKSHDA